MGGSFLKLHLINYQFVVAGEKMSLLELPSGILPDYAPDKYSSYIWSAFPLMSPLVC